MRANSKQVREWRGERMVRERERILLPTLFLICSSNRFLSLGFDLSVGATSSETFRIYKKKEQVVLGENTGTYET